MTKTEKVDFQGQFSYKDLVKKYFGIDLLVGENTPKLSKQLSKAGKDYTNEELQAFQELLNAVYDGEKEESYRFIFTNILPDYEEIDDWAFDGSCNSQGECGQATSYVLNTLEEARYCYIYDTWNDPSARFYYVQDCNGVLGVADLYCDNGHGYYLAPQILLCVAYGKRLSDFTKYKDPLVYMTNDSGYWSNLSASSYNHYVTGEIEPIEPYDEVINDFNKYIGKIWSNNLNRYIDQDDNYFVYCSNIEDYEWSDGVHVCDHCSECLSTRGDYIEANDGTIFCSEDCASHDYIYSKYYEGWIDREDASECADCGCVFPSEDGKWDSDDEFYCPDCIHDHLEEEEED
jgi:hypothetical protein|nr:MAG TPA: zinc-ribbon domain protein [Caudoviricetes sp.]